MKKQSFSLVKKALVVVLAVMIAAVSAPFVGAEQANAPDTAFRKTLDAVTSNGVSYGNGTFVSIANNGEIRTSADGKNWVKRQSGTSLNFRKIIFGDNEFIAIAYDDDASRTDFFASSDGKSWALKGTLSANMIDIVYGNQGYLIMAQDDTHNFCSKTTDFKAFTPVNVGSGDSYGGLGISYVYYSSGVYYLFDRNFGYLLSSTDLSKWNSLNSPYNDLYINSFAVGNGYYIAYGMPKGNINNANVTVRYPATTAISADTMASHEPALLNGMSSEGVIFDGNSFVMQYYNSTGGNLYLVASADGSFSSLTGAVKFDFGIDAVCSGGGRYVVVAGNGSSSFLFSGDSLGSLTSGLFVYGPESWGAASSDAAGNGISLYLTGSQDEGVIVDKGGTFTRVPAAKLHGLSFDSISFSNGKFYLFGYDSSNKTVILTTTDGVTFSQLSGFSVDQGVDAATYRNVEPYKILYCNGKYYLGTFEYATGYSSYRYCLYSSSDGIAFSHALTLDTPAAIDMIYSGGKYYAYSMGSNDLTVYSSSNGVSFSQAGVSGLSTLADTGSLLVANRAVYLFGTDSESKAYVYASTNGTSFTSKKLTNSQGNQLQGTVMAAAYGNGEFNMAFEDFGETHVYLMKSTDGHTFTATNTFTSSQYDPLYFSVFFSDSTFYAPTSEGSLFEKSVGNLVSNTSTGISARINYATLPAGTISATLKVTGASSSIVSGANKLLSALGFKAIVFDNIQLLNQNGVAIEPGSSVTVRIPVPKGQDGSKLKVFWYDGTTKKLTNMKATLEDGYLVFTTSHFSDYLIARVASSSNSGGSGNPDTGDPSPLPLMLVAIMTASLVVLAVESRRIRAGKRLQ